MGRARTEPGSWGKITLKQIGKSEWTATAYYKSPVSGRFLPKTRSGRNESIAASNLTKHLENLQKLGVDSLEAADATSDTIKAGDSCAKLLSATLLRKSRKIRPQSMTSYKSAAKYIYAGLDRWRVSDLNVARVDAVMDSVKGKYTQSAKVKILLNEMVALAWAEGALSRDRNPLHEVTAAAAPVVDAADIVIVTPAEATQVFAAIASYRQGPGVRGRRPDGQLLDLFMLQSGSGLRMGEAIGLRRKSVLPPTAFQPEWRVVIDSTVVVRKGEGVVLQAEPKNSTSRRSIPVTGYAVEALQRRLDKTSGTGPDSPLFPSERGTWRAPGKFDTQWRDILTANPHLPQFSSHAWRHTVATAIDAEASSRYAKLMLGHKLGDGDVLHTNYVKRVAIVPVDERAMNAIVNATVEPAIRNTLAQQEAEVIRMRA